MHRSKPILFALTLLLLLTAAAYTSEVRAQAVYGNISGTVTDPSGAVVAGATVTIRSTERNTTDTVQSNESGLYVKERLLPGIYEVRVEQAGFKQAIISTVNVNVDTTTPVDVQLSTGEVTESVTVSAAEGQLLRTDRADVATTFEAKQITDLPVVTRNFTRFVLLTPGTQVLGFQHAASENPQGSTQTIVNGQTFSGTGYQLDGTDNRDPILGIIVVNPTLESIGETKITSQNYDAEFGQAIAGVVAVQTKSGRNDFFGSAFAFRQNDVLQARDPFTQVVADRVTGKLVPDTLRNQFGGSLGGRIIRDKLFFFGDYEGTRSKLGGSRLLSVPTEAARRGDLSAYGINVYDPVQFNPTNPAASLTVPLANRTQFANNIIPTARLSQQALNLLDLIPRPNLPGDENGTRNNYAASGSEIFDRDAFNVRIDGRLSENFNMFGRYSFLDSGRDGPTALGIGGGQELVSLGGTSQGRNHSVALGFDYTLSPTSIVDVRLGYFRYQVAVRPFDFGTTPLTDAGIGGLNLDREFSSGLSAGFVRRVGGEELFNFGTGLGVNRSNSPLDQQEDQFQVVGNFTKSAGNHTLKFGTDIRRAYNLRVPSDAHRSGELTFSGDRTSGPNGAGGFGLATLLLGDVTNFRRYVSTRTDAKERQWRHFYYGQDTWRINPRLTIAYGLRLDVINPQVVNAPGAGGFLDLDTGEIRVAGVGDIPLNGGVENTLNFAPRLGIAYQPNDRTVIRVGYGRSYDIGVFGSVFGHSVTQNLPVLAVQELNPSQNFERVFRLADGAPAPASFFGLNAPPNQGGVENASLPANGRFFLPNGVFARALPEKQRLPAVDAYNLTVQHQLTPDLSLEVGYVGNKGTHVFAGDGPAININQPTLQGFGALTTDQRRPYFNRFGWSQGIDYFCNCADNRYDSLQAKLTRRFTQGFSFNANYTLARGLNNDGDQFFYERGLGRGPADWDRTHTFIFTNVAELPFGRNRRFLTDAPRAVDLLIGGWQFNSATRIATGRPFNIGYREAGADRDAGPNRPNLIGNVDTGGPQSRYFNATPIGSPGSAFARPDPGTFGNLPRNRFRGPGYWNSDASIFKRFYFGEVTNLEFRVEAQNVFNHVNLGLPDATIGVPGNDNPNAGIINSLENTFLDRNPMRNFQFALKLIF